jgi:hypothetical protein
LNGKLINDVKGNKKTAEVKPGTSPTLSTPNSEDASLTSELLGDNNGTANDEEIKEEHTPSSEVLEGISPFTTEEPGNHS